MSSITIPQIVLEERETFLGKTEEGKTNSHAIPPQKNVAAVIFKGRRRNILRTCESFSPLSSDAVGCPCSPEGRERFQEKELDGGKEETGGIRIWVLG